MMMYHDDNHNTMHLPGMNEQLFFLITSSLVFHQLSIAEQLIPSIFYSQFTICFVDKFSVFHKETTAKFNRPFPAEINQRKSCFPFTDYFVYMIAGLFISYPRFIIGKSPIFDLDADVERTGGLILDWGKINRYSFTIQLNSKPLMYL